MMTAWLDLTNLLRTITDVLFPSATGIRELLGGCRYVNIIKHFQQQLLSWKITHLRLDSKCIHALFLKLLIITLVIPLG